MKKTILIIISTIIISVLGTLFYLGETETLFSGKPENKSVNNITIGYPTLRIALPVFVAQEKGYFKEQDLNVTLKSYDTAQPMMDALVSGKINIGGFCALPITFGAMARSKTDLLFLGGMYENNSNPISILLVKDTNKIKTVQDLKGKRIGILPTRAYEVWLQQILASNNIAPDDVVIRHVPPNLQADMLNSGGVDALFTNDPAATITMTKGFGEQLGGERALVPLATGMNPFYFGSFNIRKDYADNHPEIVKKISIAIDKAIKFIRDNDKDAKLAMKKYLPESQQKYVSNFPSSYFKVTNEVSNDDLKEIKDYYYEQQVLPVNIEINNLQYGR
jgi:NitT/TauT family transport system substrate-binding protein